MTTTQTRYPTEGDFARAQPVADKVAEMLRDRKEADEIRDYVKSAVAQSVADARFHFSSDRPQLESFRASFRKMAEAAGLEDPDDFTDERAIELVQLGREAEEK